MIVGQRLAEVGLVEEHRRLNPGRVAMAVGHAAGEHRGR
jgi:hypothetical protein